jgi:hypothetical protein
MRLLFSFLCLAFNITVVSAQIDTTSINKQFVIGVTYMQATMLVHTQKMNNVRGAKPKGYEVEFSKLNLSSKIYHNWGFYSRSGFTFSYFNLNTPILGTAYGAAYFIEPIFKISNRVQLRVRGAMGLGYLTHPNKDLADTSITANFNYGTNINASLHLSLATSVNITNHLSAYIRGTFSHNSNAGFAIPNLGINYPSLGVGFLYHQVSNRLPNNKRIKDYSWKKNNPLHYEVGMFFTGKDGWTGVGQKYKKQLLIGANITASKRVSNINGLTFGLEAYYDGGIALTKSVINDPSRSYYASVLFGNEFYLKRITLNTQVGVHFIRSTDYYNKIYLKGEKEIGPLYQRFGISYQLHKRYKIGFNLLTRLNIADYFDFRLTYKLK